MRAVNLVPADARRGPVGPRGAPRGPAHVVIALLGVALAFVTVYVLTNNTISQRRAKAAELKAETAREQAQVSTYTRYTQFAKLAQARAATVRQIASTRFDWYGALSDLAKVMPADASLQSLSASVSPDSGNGSSSGSPSSTASGLRGTISAPAFELTGCTATQDDVARLMSRLRLINGVTRVTLSDSAKPNSGQPSTAGGGSAGSSGCKADAPSFDLIVFFQPLPGAGAAGTASGTPPATPATPTAAASAAAGASATSTTSTATPTPNASTPSTTTTTGAATTTPVGTTTTAGGTK